MLNRNTIKKKLRNNTLLGREWDALVACVVEITLRVCDIDIDSISDDELDQILERIEEINLQK